MSPGPTPTAPPGPLVMSSIWAGYLIGVGPLVRYPKGGDGTVTGSMVSASLGFPTEPGAFFGVAGLAAAPDGTMYVLQTDDALNGGSHWRIVTVAPPGAKPGTAPVYDGDGNPYAVELGPNGVLVESYSRTNGISIRTYPYGAIDPPATRTFQPTPNAGTYFGFAVGPDGRIYIPRLDGFDVYAADATGCCPVTLRTAYPPTEFPGLFKIGRDGSIFSAQLVNYFEYSGGTPSMYVNVYPPGSGAIARRIGPLPLVNDVLSHLPVIAVDANNTLYVATNFSLYVFGPSANGNVAPDHLMTYGISAGWLDGLAIGP